MAATDLLYFSVAAVMMSAFVYFINNGKVRWYIYLGSLGGFAAYYFTIGRVVISLSSIIAYGIRRALYVIAVCLYEPFRPIVSYVRLIFNKAIELFKKGRKENKEKKQVTSRCVLMEYGKK